jgi:aspartate kinase
MDVQVFKFGGASVRDKEQIENVTEILKHFRDVNLIVIISAMGKTTNALEEVVDRYFYKTGDPYIKLEEIKKQHYSILDLLVPGSSMLQELNDVFISIEWILEEEVEDSYAYVYDQIVSAGELLSTKIVHAYLLKEGLSSHWLDVRDVLITDDTYREAKVDWAASQAKISKTCGNILEKKNIVVTQGFIGSSAENNTTTLGREGSDYTAGIFSFCLDAKSMHIWKDVPGILTADPAQFDNVAHIERLSYKEAVEMTYYGAKVIHPKTIKPLQNKEIPLYVRPFNNFKSLGTIITKDTGNSYPPIVVIEPNQTLLHISANDFSFIAEHHLSMIFTLLHKHRIKVNMMVNTAISFTLSVNHDEKKIESFIAEVGIEFKILLDKDLELITVRHYSDSLLESMKSGKVVLLEEVLKDTARVVVKDIPMMKRKNK